MLKIIKNPTISTVMIKDTGIEVPAGGSYTIQSQDYWLWVASTDAVTQIVAGNLIVNDGEDDLTNLRYAIGLIQDNQIVVNEYYTLVQEDDVLIGNGEILSYNDQFDTTDNVPFELDMQLVDDDDY